MLNILLTLKDFVTKILSITKNNYLCLRVKCALKVLIDDKILNYRIVQKNNIDENTNRQLRAPRVKEWRNFN